MASRYSRDSLSDERDYLPPRRPRSEAGYYEREERREDVRVRERSRERGNPLDRYFREERRPEAGPLVLRERQVESFERPRQRSPSPVRIRQVIHEHSVSESPPHRHPQGDRLEVRERVVERSHSRERRQPVRSSEDRLVVVDRGRQRSPSSSPDREEIRIVSHSRSRAPSPSPSPPPARPVIQGPVVEREVIAHYTDVDHGVVYAQPPPPPPPPEPVRTRDTEIGIYRTGNRTEVDISDSRPRERRPQSRPPPPRRAAQDELVVRTDRSLLQVDVDDRRPRRAHSATPPIIDRYSSSDDDEASYIESRIDARGRAGEAYHGATRDWTIVDVPPGTERVRMDGVGGGGADVTWQRYNGVRRTKFIPERQEELMTVAVPERDRPRIRKQRERDHVHEDRINVQIVDKGHGRSGREVDVVRDDEMWTEITKDLVCREAIERVGYAYTEEKYFYYILQYLSYDDVQELVELTDRIRRRRDRHKPRYAHDEIDIDVRRRRSHSHHRGHRDGRAYEKEVVVDRHLHPGRAYY